MRESRRIDNDAVTRAIPRLDHVDQHAFMKPLTKATTREFHIGGSWDDPQVTRTNARAEGGVSAPASAPASAIEPQSEGTS